MSQSVRRRLRTVSESIYESSMLPDSATGSVVVTESTCGSVAESERGFPIVPEFLSQDRYAAVRTNGLFPNSEAGDAVHRIGS